MAVGHSEEVFRFSDDFPGKTYSFFGWEGIPGGTICSDGILVYTLSPAFKDKESRFLQLQKAVCACKPDDIPIFR